MNYYPFHLGDYKKRTHYLSLMEDLCYRRMIDLYYLTEAPLPLEIDTIARLIGMRDHITEVNTIVCDFFTKSDAGYTHERCEEEITKYRGKQNRASKLAQKRWHPTESECEVVSDTHTTSNANQEPEPVLLKPIGKKKVADAPVVCPQILATNEFTKAWDAYVEYRKVMKFKPLKATSIQRTWDLMATWGHDAAIESINNTIRNGWQGMFEPKTGAAPIAKPTFEAKYTHSF